MSDVGTAAALVAFPVAAACIGAVAAATRPPGPRVTSAVQHFAAGVVIAAVAGEVLPDLRTSGSLAAVVIGFVLGVAVLIGLSQLEQRTTTPRNEQHDQPGSDDQAEPTEPTGPDRQGGAWSGGQGSGRVAAALPVGLLVAVGVDLLIDGVLVGLGVTLGQAQGRVLTIALTLEILFLALSVTAELSESGIGRTRAALIPIGLSLAVVVGALGAVVLLADAPAPLVTGVVAFGAAALLYLVTEELLTEAHEAATETAALTATFFLGFLALYVLETLA